MHMKVNVNVLQPEADYDRLYFLKITTAISHICSVTLLICSQEIEPNSYPLHLGGPVAV